MLKTSDKITEISFPDIKANNDKQHEKIRGGSGAGRVDNIGRDIENLFIMQN